MNVFTLAQALADGTLEFSADMRMLSVGRVEILVTAWGSTQSRIFYNVEERSYVCKHPFTGTEMPAAFSEALLHRLPEKIKAQCAAASITAAHR